MTERSTVDVTEADFPNSVIESSRSKPVLVDFWADWCRPCKMIAPVLEEIAASKADSLTIAKVDIVANPGLAQDYTITSIPAMMVFVDGVPVKRITGARPKSAILADLAEFLG